MRTREEILAKPLLWDVILFVNGRFERHQSHETLPVDALYLTCAVDLMQCGFATRGIKTLTSYWKSIRKMPVTHPADPRPPYPIPRDSSIWAPKSAPKPPGRRKAPGSQSLHHRGRWPSALRGIQTIKLVYEPGRIEGHDIALASLPRRAQDCVRAMLAETDRKTWTRKQLEELFRRDARAGIDSIQAAFGEPTA